MSFSGGCLCGAVRHEANAEPFRQFVCHCTRCQRHTGSSFFCLRSLFWANGQAGLWRKMGLTEVTEVAVVVDCEYASFLDYWATFTGGQGRFASLLMALSNDVSGAIDLSGNPSWSGDQLRLFTVDGDRLTIRTPEQTFPLSNGRLMVSELVWERERFGA